MKTLSDTDVAELVSYMTQAANILKGYALEGWMRDFTLELQLRTAAVRLAVPDPETPTPAEPDYKLNADKTVVVSNEVFLEDDMTTCPRGYKVQLLGKGGILMYGRYDGDDFWQAWAPCPRRRRKSKADK